MSDPEGYRFLPHATGDLREQMLREMLRALCVDHGHDRRLGGMNCRTCRRRVDVLLALPAIRDALAAQEERDRLREFAEWVLSIADDPPARRTVTLEEIIQRAALACDDDLHRALPEVRDALAAQEAVKRVEFAVNEFYWLAENGHTVIDTAHIRRALAGDS